MGKSRENMTVSQGFSLFFWTICQVYPAATKPCGQITRMSTIYPPSRCKKAAEAGSFGGYFRACDRIAEVSFDGVATGCTLAAWLLLI
jgi:hypothetical protein